MFPARLSRSLVAVNNAKNPSLPNMDRGSAASVFYTQLKALYYIKRYLARNVKVMNWIMWPV